MLTIGKLMLSALRTGVYPGGAGAPWLFLAAEKIDGRLPIFMQHGVADGNMGTGALFFFAAGPYVPASLAATETVKLTASDAADRDYLGYSAAVSGDTVILGAVSDDIDSNIDQGSAYVFDLTTGPIVQPLAAPTPHDRSKNRYVSFVPNNGWSPVAFQITKTAAPMGTAWVGAPDANGVARVVVAPVTRIWLETVVHVGDCEIVPIASYALRTTNDGVAFSAPLSVSTIALPSSNDKLWADTVGTNNGSEWTPPNHFTNINDILGILAYISGAAIRPHFTMANLQAVSTADPCLNGLVNTSDVLIAVKAVAGNAYPFTTNPANCPDCP